MTDLNALLDAHRAATAAPQPDINAALDEYRANSAPQTTYDPTEGMTGWDKFVAGYGSAVPSMALAAKQRLAESQVSTYANMPEADRAHTNFDPASVKDNLDNLYAQQAENAKLDAPLNSSWQGTAGNLAGTAAPSIAASLAVPGSSAIAQNLIGPRLAALGLRMGGNAAAGAAQSLLTPTTSEEDRNKNADISAALSAILPVAGSAVRATVGRMDPIKQRLVDTLRQAGISVSNAREYGGGLNTVADKIINVVPGLGSLLRGSIEDKRGQVANAIASIATGEAGTAAPATKLAADEIVGKVGGEYGNLYKGLKVDPTVPGQVADAQLAANAAHDPRLIGRDALTAIRDTQNKAYSGTALTGKEYRNTLDYLNNLTGETGAPGDIARALRDSWQSAGRASMTPEQRVGELALNSRYALANRLRDAVGEKGANLGSITGKMTASGAALPQQATDLAEAGNSVFEEIHKPHQWQHYGLWPAVATALVYKPGAVAGAATAVPLIKAALNAPGAPLQRAANNPTSRAVTAAILRSAVANQVENANASGQ